MIPWKNRNKVPTSRSAASFSFRACCLPGRCLCLHGPSPPDGSGERYDESKEYILAGAKVQFAIQDGEIDPLFAFDFPPYFWSLNSHLISGDGTVHPSFWLFGQFDLKPIVKGIWTAQNPLTTITATASSKWMGNWDGPRETLSLEICA